MQYLYYLIDPNTNMVRYVGITKNPKTRIYQHVYCSRYRKTHKDNWICSLLIKNQKPIMKIVCERETRKEILIEEINHIKKYHDLTNSTSGGEIGFILDERIIRKLRRINKGSNNPNYGKKWSKEQREKHSKLLSERKLTESHKDKLRKSANKRKILINNIEYESVIDASRKLNIAASTIYDRHIYKNTKKKY